MVQVQEREQIEPVAPRLPSPPAAPAQPTLWRSWMPYVLIVGVAFALRMWDLGSRAMHHDESLHALYGWYLYVGRGYVHDPMMHGPFLFHLTALMYLLFGDSEVSFRFSFVLLGTAAIALTYFLRHELGRVGSVAAALMLAFGPVFMYFSRFGHNESLLLFQELLVVVGLFGWLRTRRAAYLYAAAIAYGLMFSTKMTSLMFGFIVAAFVAAAIGYETWRKGEEQPVLTAVRDVGWSRLVVCVAIVLGISVVLYTTFFTNLEGLCTAFWSPSIGSCAGKQGMLQYWLAQQGVARGSQPWFYYLLLIPLYAIVPLTLSLAAPFLAPRPRSHIFWFTAWWALASILLYSYAAEKMPWLVVHPTTPLVLLGALTVEGVARHFRRPWGLTPRQWSLVGLAVLAVAALIALASAGAGPAASALAAQSAALRKIPLLLILAALLASALAVAFRLTTRQALGALGAGALAILVVYSLHTAWQVTYKNGDIPVEMLVYVQSSPDVPYIAREVERLGNETGLRKDLPILLDGGYTENVGGQNVEHEAVSWPFEWYFRNYTAKTYYSKTLPGDFSTGKYAALLVMGTNLDPIRDQLSGYTGHKMRLNWWYPEDYKQLTWSTIPQTLLDPQERLKLLKYILYRELMNPPLGAREMWFYERNDLIGGGAGAAPSEAAASVPPGRPNAAVPEVGSVRVIGSMGRPGGVAALREPKGVATGPDGKIYVADAGSSTVTVFNPDGTVAGTWGTRGDGDGQFNEPWGIAVAPDGSVFVADTWNHRIQKFDASGRFLLKWGTGQIGSEPSRFYGPRDIAITPSGQVLVTDTGNKRIQVFDQNGVYYRSFGTEGAGLGQFREPVGIAVDAQGKVYVADTWNERIQVFDATFQPLGQYAVSGWSSQTLTNKPYLAVSSDGTVYATRPDDHSIVRVQDGLVGELALPAGTQLRQPVGIKLDRDGHLLASDSQSGTIVELDVGAGADAESSDASGQ